MPKDKNKLFIERRHQPEQGTLVFGFIDRRYSLPVFTSIEVRQGWVYGNDGKREWALGQNIPGYQLEGQKYGEVIFKKVA